jgi:hypothetical protein
MIHDRELQEWQRQWRAQPSVPMDLFKHVDAGTSYMRQYRIAEVLATVFLGGGTVWLASIYPTWHSMLLVGLTWLGISVAWIVSLRLTRDLWSAAAPTTAAYLDLAQRRCRWKMRDARYDSVQSVLLTAGVLWVDRGMLQDLQREPGPFWLYVTLFVVISSVLVSLFESKRRKAKAQLEELLAIQRQLDTN